MIAFDLRSLEFVVVQHHQIDVFVDLVALALIGGIDRLTDYNIHQLLPQPIAGLYVDLPEGAPFAGVYRGVKCDRAGDQRQLEIALPTRSHGHT